MNICAHCGETLTWHTTSLQWASYSEDRKEHYVNVCNGNTAGHIALLKNEKV